MIRIRQSGYKNASWEIYMSRASLFSLNEVKRLTQPAIQRDKGYYKQWATFRIISITLETYRFESESFSNDKDLRAYIGINKFTNFCVLYVQEVVTLQKKYLIYLHQKMRSTPFINYYDTLSWILFVYRSNFFKAQDTSFKKWSGSASLVIKTQAGRFIWAGLHCSLLMK